MIKAVRSNRQKQPEVCSLDLPEIHKASISVQISDVLNPPGHGQVVIGYNSTNGLSIYVL